MDSEVKLRLSLVGELCKYYFNHKFTKSGFIVYIPCTALCIANMDCRGLGPAERIWIGRWNET